MDKTAGWVFLQSLWSGIHPDELVCCDCGYKIQPDEGLARTFSLSSQGVSTERQWAERIPVPALHDEMVVYHRHLACLFQSTQYITISHVWHLQVANLQYKKLESTSSIDEVEKVVREIPALISRSLATSLKLQGKFEIWHDYISVPQWIPELKGRIILSIPDIYRRALTTVAYLSDIDVHSVTSMREGRSVYERCRGISDICNSTWFSRVWTAMEYSQSRELQVMLKDFTLVDDPVQKTLLEEINERWGEEVVKQGTAQATERMVGMGNNLVPWQLGPLRGSRIRTLRGIRTPFASAYQLFSRRCVTVPRDFFHALLGILKPKVTEAQLSLDVGEATLQVARSCLKAGDFSPLFMIPASAQVEANPTEIQSYGYLDISIFSLDEEMASEESQPIFPEVMFHSDHPTIHVECLGIVRFIRFVRESVAKSLVILSRLTLEYTGLDVKEFVTTLGARLYGQELDKIFQRLSEGDRMRLLREQLRALCNTSPEDSDGISSRIAEIVGLSDRSALGGGYHKSNLSPMQFLGAHGGSMHLGDAGAIVGVNCPRCHQSFLLRVALLEPPSELLGIKAYRVPGLRYRFTHAGGCGFLLKEGRIVGRFIWGSPTCECHITEEVEVVLEAPPMPQPNNFKYGQTGQTEWLPLSLGNRVRWIAEREF